MNKDKKNRNLDCDIVSDLLSLYHDGVVKETTAESIKQHLMQCTCCQKEYQELCVELPIETEGIARPVNDLSRGCSVDDVYKMIAITANQAIAAKEQENK